MIWRVILFCLVGLSVASAHVPRQAAAQEILARTAQTSADAPLQGHVFYHSDANGNVTMLINPDQAIVARYLYDCFGNLPSKSGLLADANPAPLPQPGAFNN